MVHNIACLTTQPRKKRLYGSVEGLGNRLALLESLVKGLLPEADVSNVEGLRQLGSSLGIPLPDASTGEPSGDRDHSDASGEDSSSLLPDQQGQVQFIGPASSFAFHVKLRTLVGAGALRQFVLFGNNAAEQEPGEHGDPHNLAAHNLTTAPAPAAHDALPPERRSLPGPASFEPLLAAFFANINVDLPVLHEPSFREAYDVWLASPDKVDPSWLCSFLCVLLLSRRVARIAFPPDQEKVWWRRVQTLLPVVIFTSSMTAVQALLLASIHLHNSNHRDACWNLTGTAIRIAYAIGLHQDKVSPGQIPLARELRRQLWWVLYAFEQLQVSSYDRPSAIQHPGPRISSPNHKTTATSPHAVPDYGVWFHRLVTHLGAANRAPKTVKQHASEESYVGPLSPAAAVLRDMQRWMDSLPQHMRIEAADTSPANFQRPILLMHSLYHYIVVVLCRAALLARASILTKDGPDSPNSALISMATSCSESGQDLGRLLLKIDALGKFDAIIACDIWYTLASSSVLLLDLVCQNKLAGTDMTESRILLSQLADLAQRHMRNPYMPGTNLKFASIIPELHCMADSINASASPVATSSGKDTDVAPIGLNISQQQQQQQQQKQQQQQQQSHSQPSHSQQQPHAQPQQETGPYPYIQSTTNSGAYMFADNMPGRYHAEPAYVGVGPFPTERYDRNTHPSHFMDFTINNIHDWNWGDLGSLLGNEAGVPGLQAQHGHVSSGPPVGPS